MSIRNGLNFLLSAVFAWTTMLSFFKVDTAQAQIGVQYGGSFAGGASAGYGLNGTGYYGGVQPCRSPWRANTQIKTKEDSLIKKEYKNIAKKQKELDKKEEERDKLDDELSSLERRLTRVLDSDVIDFVLHTHIDVTHKCEDYRPASCYTQARTTAAADTGTTAAGAAAQNGTVTPVAATPVATTPAPTPAPVPVADECKKPEVIAKLRFNWTTGGAYCKANSDADKGLVDASGICTDQTLRPDNGTKATITSPTECAKYLADYRKNKLKRDDLQAKIDKLDDDIEIANDNIDELNDRRDDAIERKQSRRTEAYCPECAASGNGYTYEKPERDWAGSLFSVAAGLTLGAVGAGIDKRNAAYSAQLGQVPQSGYPTAVALGAPLVLGGIYGAINGGSAQGGFGCAAGLNGTGFPFGANGGLYGNGIGSGAFGPYGPYAAGAGGAFGYPQGLFGNPYGGGAYLPGYGANGLLNGPNGGYPFGGGLGGFQGLGIAVSGGFGAAIPGYQGLGGAGFQGLGGYQGIGLGGALGIGGALGGGYPQLGGQLGGYQQLGGYPGLGGQLGGAIGGGIGAAIGGIQDPQYQLQLLQIQQQQAQVQAQYYQQQVQQQQQQYQRQIQITQQAAQVQQEIQSLQVRLQLLYSGAYTGTGTGPIGGGYTGGTGGGYIGGGIVGGIGGSIGTAAPTVGIGSGFLGGATAGYGGNINTPPPFIPVNNQINGGIYQPQPYPTPYYPSTGTQVTIPSGGR